MTKYITPALIANAASLGVHWIYDVNYLLNLSEQQALLFLRQEKERYDKADPAYFAYPNTDVGDVSVQGEILKWLYKALFDNSNFSDDDYKLLLYKKFMPGGSYQGYVEIYAKKLVLINLLNQLKKDSTQILMNDNNLVGFMPYLVAKEFNLSNEKAWSLAQVLTNNTFYPSYYEMFDFILENLKNKGLKQAIGEAIILGPKAMQTSLEKAIDINDTNHFIENFAGRACSIEDAVPLIIHILYFSTSFEQAIELNAKMGGASSDRALLLGAILNQVYPLPEAWVIQVGSKLKL